MLLPRSGDTEPILLPADMYTHLFVLRVQPSLPAPRLFREAALLFLRCITAPVPVE